MKMSRAPTNQAERPPLVMKLAVTVAIITMVTAPGQNCRLIGDDPTTYLSSTSAGATNSAIWAALPSAMLTLMSRRSLRAAAKATANSAAAPTTETTMKPTNAGLIPKVSAAFCTDSTKISLTSATSTVTTSSVPTARLIGQY